MSIVIKYGGNAMTIPDIRERVARSISGLALTGLQPVVIHGGGPMIATALRNAGMESDFARGLRVTTPESLPIIEAALTTLNKELSQLIGNAVGLSGRDSHLLVASQLDEELGLVGEIESVNSDLIGKLLQLDLTPVIACLAEGSDGRTMFNVNADSVAGAVAGALGAPVVFLTDVPGVLDNPGDPTSLLQELSRSEIEGRIEDGRISGGMIPKVEAALFALHRGAAFAVIADGRNAKALEPAARGEAGTTIHR